MIFDLQKASMWKRASAWLLDFISLTILATGFAWAISSLTGYERYGAELEKAYTAYAEEYGISFETTEEQYNAMSEADRARYDAAYAALSADGAVLKNYNMMVSLTLLMISLGILLAMLIVEFLVPLKLGDGRTLGKRIFGIGVMRTSGVRMPTVALFIRTFIGKYTVETMIPVTILIMIYFNQIGVLGPAILFLILLVQLGVLIGTRTNSAIHDLLADTVTVDYPSQMIFASEEELLKAKKKAAAEKASRSVY